MIKTTSLGLSKKLREAGFPQKTENYYIPVWDATRTYNSRFEQLNSEEKYNYAAPTGEEILEKLPLSVKNLVWNIRPAAAFNGNYDVFYGIFEPWYKSDKDYFRDDNIAEAAGKMWLYLKEKGLL